MINGKLLDNTIKYTYYHADCSLINRSIARGKKRRYNFGDGKGDSSDMNIRLLFAIAFVLLLPASAFVQNTISAAQPNKDNSLCLNFPTPVIKPDVNENKLPIVKPDSNVDYKLIVVNPCVAKTEQSSDATVQTVPKPKNGARLKLPMTQLNLNQSNSLFTPKVQISQQPK